MIRESQPLKSNSALGEMRTEVIAGRPPRGYWWPVIAIVIFGIVSASGLYFGSPQSSPNSFSSTQLIVALVIGGFFVGLGVLGGWSLARTIVIADENGLRWRGLGVWKNAAWMQVRDYYTKPLPKGGKSHIVETEAGKLELNNLSHGALLRQTVQERARWAKARQWEERAEKTPPLELSGEETFVVDSDARDFWFGLFLTLCVLPLLLMFKASPTWNAPLKVYAMIRQTWQTMGALWALGLVFMVAFPGLLYSLMIFARWPLVREARRRKGQSVTVSPYGIMWRDAASGREIKARWEEVRDFHTGEVSGWVRLEARRIVETTRGDFDYVSLRNGARLQALIQMYCARHGLQQEWDTKSKRRAVASSSEPQTFTYRDSPLRAMLFLTSFLALAMCFSAYARYTGLITVRNQQPGDPGDLLLGLFFGGPLLAMSIWMWRQYSCFEIRTDERGLAQRCGRQSRFIAWPDIQEYETVAGWSNVQGANVQGANETIRFYAALGGASELQKIIQHRATCSRTRVW